MKRMAIFVEGQTEQEFVCRLIGEIAGQQNLQLETKKSYGKRGRRSRVQQYVWPDSPTVKFYVLVVDCGGDETVASDICEEYESLVNKGYGRIIGIRDVRPRWKRKDVAKLESATEAAIKQRVGAPKSPVEVLFAVMEIEAWFIAEATHFQQIKSVLTCELIQKRLGFDPSCDDVEAIDHPAAKLNAIYQLAGAGYRKTKGVAQRTIGNLDYEQLYMNVSKRIPRFGRLVGHLDEFVSH